VAVIKTIANWQELYPAFALCDALNTGGVTGWYLPAYQEAMNIRNKVPGYTFWSSTAAHGYNGYYSYTSNGGYYRDNNYYIVAVHRF
jgi:hypothetical protein